MLYRLCTWHWRERFAAGTLGVVIIDGAWYLDGERVLETDDISDLGDQRGRQGFGWLGLAFPTDDEFSAATAAFGIPERALATARRRHARPKVEFHGETLLVVVPTARYLDDEEIVEFGQLFFFVGSDYVVTVRHGAAAPLHGVRAELEDRRDILGRGTGAVLRAALAHVVASYGPVIDGIEDDVRQVEHEVFSEARKLPLRRIYFLISEVLDFLIALEPLKPVLKTLGGGSCSEWVDDRIVPLFHELEESLAIVLERTRTASELLNNALSATLGRASMRQNEDMRKISAWAAIGVAPTVVAGLLGMNLDGIPAADHPAAFGVVCAICVTLCAVLYRTFRKSGWI